MPICASCGQPVDVAKTRAAACPSCTWRAALRVSQASATDETSTTAAMVGPLLSADDDFCAIDDEPGALIDRLQDLAAAASEPIDDGRARRVHAALLRGNSRPYQTEMNRLVARFIEKLEETWQL